MMLMLMLMLTLMLLMAPERKPTGGGQTSIR